MSEGGDEEDHRRQQIAIGASTVVVAGGLAAVLAITYLEQGCNATSCGLEGLLMVGLLVSWPTLAAVITTRFAMHRQLGNGVALALLLVAFALHFIVLVPTWNAHMAFVGFFAASLEAWALFIAWPILTGVGLAALWFGANAVERWLPS